MNLSQQVAKHFKELYFGGNWTCVSMKETLGGVTLKEATTKVSSLNTIAVLVFHMNYYVDAITQVLQGNPLEAHDKYSFELPPLQSEEEWQHMLAKTFTNAETLAGLIEQLPEERLWEIFRNDKYGIYYRNLHGLIEHSHYHLGQISLLKKMIREQVPA
ncbi:MAG: DUF1572 domain-containing protein [Sphingobacteriales bacterium]|nr:MAG: DUF1572 domain-containing protein [Sphingobacteriales bacterium]